MMARRPARSAFARQFMQPFGVDRRSTWTLVRLTDVGAQPKTNGDVDSTIVQT